MMVVVHRDYQRQPCMVCGKVSTATEEADMAFLEADIVLCQRCDALGRLAAARLAHKDKTYADAVKKGYDQRG